MPSGFDGYYTLMAQNYPPGVLARPALLRSEMIEQGMVNSTLIGVAPSLVGTTQDPNNGIAIISVFDCTSTPASGLTISIGSPTPDERVYYFVNSLPTPSATSTDNTGSAIIFNVPPGSVAATATLPGSTQTLRTMTAITRAGWVSFVNIRPDQAAVRTP
jgi:hypothetical protein